MLELLIKTCRVARAGRDLELVPIAAKFEARLVSELNLLAESDSAQPVAVGQEGGK